MRGAGGHPGQLTVFGAGVVRDVAVLPGAVWGAAPLCVMAGEWEKGGVLPAVEVDVRRHRVSAGAAIADTACENRNICRISPD